MKMSKYLRILSGLVLYTLVGACVVLGFSWTGATLAQSRLSVINVVVEKTTATPRLTFAQASVTLMVGNVVADPAISDQPDSKGVISYRSSDDAVVSVAADGQITAVGAGVAVITATQAADLPGFEAGSGSYQVTVVGPVSAIASGLSSDWLVNEPVGAGVVPVRGSGGVGKLRYAIAPSLPAGLDFSADSGMLSGSAIAAAPAANYTVTVSDGATPPHSATATFRLSVAPALHLSVNRAAWVAQEGDKFDDAPVSAVGGIGALNYSVLPPLPAGLTLEAATGVIAGTVTAGHALTEHTVTVTDSASPAHAATATFTLVVNGVLTAAPDVKNHTAMVGEAIDYRPVTVAGGVAPIRYTVTPSLPDGLALDAATGAVKGMPAKAMAAADYTVTVKDSATVPRSVTAAFSLEVVDGLSATAVISTYTAVAGDPVDMTPVTATGGVGKSHFAVAPSLPAGLALNPDSGAITGAATGASKMAAYTVTVTDAASHAKTGQFSLEVNPGLKTKVPNTSVQHRVTDAVDYTPPITSGGIRPYQYTVTPALPKGLTMNAGTGAITGTAQESIAHTEYTYTVTDSATPRVHSAQGIFYLQIEPELTLDLAQPAISVAVGDSSVDQTPVTAKGGFGPPHQFSVQPDLPAGLTMDKISGMIKRVAAIPLDVLPTTSYTVTVTDSGVPLQTATAQFSLTVVPALHASVDSAALMAQEGVKFEGKPVSAAGGIGAFSYAVSPPLPTGLALDAATGVIAGTATAAYGLTEHTVTVTDSASPTHSTTATFTLAVSGVLTATPAVANHTAMVGESVDYRPVTAAGGVVPLTYTVTSPLPDGLTMDAATGAVKGTPTKAAASATYTVSVTDSAMSSPGSVTAEFSLEVVDALSITMVATTQTAVVGIPSTITPVSKIAGGIGVRHFAVIPLLPAGLDLNPDSGVISGTPGAMSPRAEYTVTVTDAASHSVSGTFSLEVHAAMATSMLKPSQTYRVKDTVSFHPVTTDGVAPYRYTVTPALPAGLTMDPDNGAVTGTPSAATVKASYTYTVTDSTVSGAQSATGAFDLTIEPELTAMPVTPAIAMVVSAPAIDETPVTAKGGIGPYRFSVAPALPAGLEMDPNSGTINRAAATVLVVSPMQTYTVTVTDALEPLQTATAQFTLRVDPEIMVTINEAMSSKPINQVLAYTPVTGTGGVGALQYAVAPPLPTGLSMDASTGEISGTPTVEQLDTDVAKYVVTITDSATPKHNTVKQSFGLVIYEPVTVTTSVLYKIYMVGDDLSKAIGAISPTVTISPAFTAYQPVTGSGAAGRKLKYLVVDGGLPAGLDMNADTGVITGTATVDQAMTSYTVWVSDPAVPGVAPVEGSFQLEITLPLAVHLSEKMPLGPDSGQPDKVFDSFLTVSGGTGGIGITGTNLSGTNVPITLSKKPGDSRKPRDLTVKPKPSTGVTAGGWKVDLTVNDAGGHEVRTSFTVDWP